MKMESNGREGSRDGNNDRSRSTSRNVEFSLNRSRTCSLERRGILMSQNFVNERLKQVGMKEDVEKYEDKEEAELQLLIRKKEQELMKLKRRRFQDKEVGKKKSVLFFCPCSSIEAHVSIQKRFGLLHGPS